MCTLVIKIILFISYHSQCEYDFRFGILEKTMNIPKHFRWTKNTPLRDRRMCLSVYTQTEYIFLLDHSSAR